ncbi:MAG: hypothetical protein OEN50_05445 [Deltaproteobacteria bacterium]|nr:hypothetical protein [Deltaproteobacteria bacterium]
MLAKSGQGAKGCAGSIHLIQMLIDPTRESGKVNHFVSIEDEQCAR